MTRWWRVLTPAGVGVSLLALGSALLADPWGLPVLAGAAGVFAAAMVAAVLVVAVPARASARLSTDPVDVDVDSAASVVVELRNTGRLPVVQPRAVVRVPRGERTVTLPWLSAGSSVRRDLPLPPLRRGVHALGPVNVQRRDPMGLVTWSTLAAPEQELYVRPRLVPVPSLGIGLLSDVDGVASDRVSMNDLAFHALREYVRGDELRHVHWRSSAKADRLLVRQFQDSRRNHATLLLDSDTPAYATRDDYELAVSVAASLGVRGLQDDLAVGFFSADEIWPHCTADVLLDACCRVKRGNWPLVDTLGRLTATVASPGLLVLVSGGRLDSLDLRRQLLEVGPAARVLAIQCEVGADPAMATSGTTCLARVGDATQLAPVLEAYAGSLV